jgi:hypothetical protein
MTPHTTYAAKPGQKCDSCGLPADIDTAVGGFCIGCVDYCTELERAGVDDTERDRRREAEKRCGGKL